MCTYAHTGYPIYYNHPEEVQNFSRWEKMSVGDFVTIYVSPFRDYSSQDHHLSLSI